MNLIREIARKHGKAGEGWYRQSDVEAAIREAVEECYQIARGGDSRFEKHGTRQLYWKGRCDVAAEIRAHFDKEKQ